MPLRPEHDVAHRHQLHPRHRRRHGDPLLHGARGRLLYGRLPCPAAGVQLVDQQPDARAGDRRDGLPGQCGLASALSGLYPAGYFARAVVPAQAAALRPRTGTEHPIAPQDDRPP